MASSPITSWQIDGESMETLRDFIFLGSKITADGDCSHKIKRCLLLVEKQNKTNKQTKHKKQKMMTKQDSMWKRRDIRSLPTKICLVKAMVFPVVIYEYESWAIKKSEPWRIDAFELWYWRRLLRVPWTARRSNESILKEISPEYSLEELMLKVKLQYLPPDGKNQLIREDPDAGKDWNKGLMDDGIVGWHHWLYGNELEQVLGDGEG